MKYITMDFVRKSLPRRDPWSHKGDFGRLLVVGGSRTYSGAPALAALAALRSGCDLVKIAAPERAANIAASFSTDLITEPVIGNYFSNRHTPFILELSKDFDDVVLGSGLGRKMETTSFVHSLLSRLEKSCVIDADAIHAVAIRKKTLKSNFILTPHSKEFFALSGQEPSRNIRERSEQVISLSEHLGCTILLKGHIDVISDGKSATLNKTGTPFMTKGGTGDTLAGMCGAFLAMGIDPFNAACSAAYVNGLAGEAASRNLGPGMLASDLLDSIPGILRTIIK